MRLNPHTLLAIEAFQRNLRAQRRQYNTEAELHRLVPRIPRDELDLYVVHTEIETQVAERREAVAAGDTATIHGIDAILVDLRAQLRTMEQRLVPEQPNRPDWDMPSALKLDPKLWHAPSDKQNHGHPRIACSDSYCGMDPASLSDTQAVILAKMTDEVDPEAELTVDEAAAQVLGRFSTVALGDEGPRSE